MMATEVCMKCKHCIVLGLESAHKRCKYQRERERAGEGEGGTEKDTERTERKRQTERERREQMLQKVIQNVKKLALPAKHLKLFV